MALSRFDGDVERDEALTLPGVLLSHAARQPDAIFLQRWSPTRGEQERCSFAALADHMLGAASWLRSEVDVQHGSLVAMLTPNSIAYLSISLGAMALGAGSVNLNWRSPTSINKLLVDELAPKVVVTSSTFAVAATAVTASGRVRLAHLEQIWPFAHPSPSLAERLRTEIHHLEPSDVAVIFFTAGTTGTPKAVPHSHAALLWFAARCLEAMPHGFAHRDGQRNGTVCFTPFFHVMGFVANLVFNLHVGVRAFILDQDATLSPRVMLEACRELTPAVLNTVPWVRMHPGRTHALASSTPRTHSSIRFVPSAAAADRHRPQRSCSLRYHSHRSHSHRSHSHAPVHRSSRGSST
jgi:long-chain acyl-CoA synthetase